MLAAVLAFNLLEIQPESNQHQCDRYQRHPQSNTPVLAFSHRLFPRIVVLRGSFHSGFDFGFYTGDVETVYRDSRFGQDVPGLYEIQTGWLTSMPDCSARLRI